MRTRVAAALMALALWAGSASAQETDALGFRYSALPGESCVTRAQMDEASLAALGVNAETLLASMEHEDQYLLCLASDGTQIALTITDKPSEISANDVSELDAAQKELLLTLLAREGRFGAAAWRDDAPGYALFSSTDGTQSELSCSQLSLATLYLGRIYAFRSLVIGRAVTEDDALPLIEAAGRTLLLGANSSDAPETPAALALPEQKALTDEKAEVAIDSNGLALTLEPIDRVIGTTTLVLRGVTAPKASLKYSVNGDSSSRFKAGADGAFTATLPNLSDGGDNKLTLTAVLGEQKAVASFQVSVDWQLTPLALARGGGEISEDSVTVEGLTLPGAKVQLIRRSSSSNVSVADDGSFSCVISLRQTGVNQVTIRALSAGYKRNDASLTFTRVAGATSTGTLSDEALHEAYASLIAQPASGKGKAVRLSGVAEALAYADGQASFGLRTAEGDLYRVLCDNLLSVREGDTLTLLGALLGSTDGSAPRVELTTLLP